MMDAIGKQILKVVQFILEWASGIFKDWTGIDFDDYVPEEKINFAFERMAEVEEIFPIFGCVSIILAGFAVAMVIRFGRYIVGFIPGVDG